MTPRLSADQIIEQAQQRTGLTRFDADTFREGLEVYLADFAKQDISDDFIQIDNERLIGLLVNRLKITGYLDDHPELLQRPIERPVFVFGIPRTGTTLLNNLLAADPARRSTLAWEIDDPVPPATSATLLNDPRALARLEQEKQMQAAYPEAGKYYRGSAIYPFECIGFTSSDFKSLGLESRGRMPGYRDWLLSTDLTSTYKYHKRFLQVLQANAPGVWNLKMPSHALWLETLLKIYPDARLVWTHRDPLTATASFCSLTAMGHGMLIGRVEREWIGENMPFQAVEHANRVMDARERLGHDRIIDVHYADLMRHPMQTMRKLYAALGDELTPEAEAAMQAWLDDNPQGKFGKHEYKLAEYGLTAEGVRSRFERYLSAYDVEPEG